jgi:cytochrome c oxidase cbb3-type subunit 3
MSSQTSSGPTAPAYTMPAEPPPGYYGRRIPQVLDHEYDGIHEFDNPTPGWWHLIWVGTIIFSVFYVMFWHFSPLAGTPQSALAAQQTREFQKLFGALGELKPDEPTILRMMGDSKMQEVAKGIFESNCAACHARDGGGINGVNLTDNSYKNVKKLEDLYATITNGANNGAMPTWRNRLSENERIIVAAFVANLRGTTPKAPRGAEGDVIPAWPTGTASTSAAK